MTDFRQIGGPWWNDSDRPAVVYTRTVGLVRQPQVVMFAALPLVMAAFGAGLVESAPARPVIGMGSGVIRMGQGGPEASDLVAGQGNQLVMVGCGAPFGARRSVCAVTARNAAASMDRVMCRYQAW